MHRGPHSAVTRVLLVQYRHIGIYECASLNVRDGTLNKLRLDVGVVLCEKTVLCHMELRGHAEHFGNAVGTGAPDVFLRDRENGRGGVHDRVASFRCQCHVDVQHVFQTQLGQVFWEMSGGDNGQGAGAAQQHKGSFHRSNTVVLLVCSSTCDAVRIHQNRQVTFP